MDDLSIINNMEFYREKAGFKKGEFAEMIGIDRATYYALVTQRRISIIKPYIYKASEVLNVSMEKILLGEDYVNRSSKELEEKDAANEQLMSLNKYYEDQIAGLQTEIRYLISINDVQAEQLKRDHKIIERLQAQK